MGNDTEEEIPAEFWVVAFTLHALHTVFQTPPIFSLMRDFSDFAWRAWRREAPLPSTIYLQYIPQTLTLKGLKSICFLIEEEMAVNNRLLTPSRFTLFTPFSKPFLFSPSWGTFWNCVKSVKAWSPPPPLSALYFILLHSLWKWSQKYLF